MAVGDLNGDGAPDIAVAGQSGVSVLFNQGDGTFGSAVDYPAGGGPIAIGDLNGDGKPDIVTGNHEEYADTVSVLLNQGDGTFAAAVSYAEGHVVTNTYMEIPALAVGDVNRDGKPDIVFGYGPGTTPDPTRACWPTRVTGPSALRAPSAVGTLPGPSWSAI